MGGWELSEKALRRIKTGVGVSSKGWEDGKGEGRGFEGKGTL